MATITRRSMVTVTVSQVTTNRDGLTVHDLLSLAKALRESGASAEELLIYKPATEDRRAELLVQWHQENPGEAGEVI